MEQCSLTEGCIFFNDKMANMPSMAEMYKNRYCKNDFAQCARFRVFAVQGRENVPVDLYPNDGDRAGRILGE